MTDIDAIVRSADTAPITLTPPTESDRWGTGWSSGDVEAAVDSLIEAGFDSTHARARLVAHIAGLARPADVGGPKKPQYEPKTDTQRLAYLVEECGEVLAAAGKSQRWGLDSYNPELPPDQRETNRAWLRRELLDLVAAIQRVKPLVGGAVPFEQAMQDWSQRYDGDRTWVSAHDREVADLKQELRILRNALEVDRTGLGRALSNIRMFLQGCSWMADGEWGSYDNEERTIGTLRAELREVFKTIDSMAEEALRESGDLAQLTLFPRGSFVG